ncbi:MAG: hypothetical protein AB7S48_14930 [Bacteroidales bacterium]
MEQWSSAPIIQHSNNPCMLVVTFSQMLNWSSGVMEQWNSTPIIQYSNNLYVLAVTPSQMLNWDNWSNGAVE